MKRVLILTIAVAMLIALGWASEAQAACGGCRNRTAMWQSQMYPWHGGYYDVAWGMPVAVLVPPTAESQTHWNWGVGATRVTPIQHQFHRGWPGPGVYERSWFRPTPHWPSSTDQFGDYYVRGPW
ncbi:MAG: hypothetical protein WCB27_22420 [Thermoguttaceae bacterium]|jgi:hypothetical protein